MAHSMLDKVMEQLDEIYLYKDTDPRRSRYLRDRLYALVLGEMIKESSSLSRDKMVSLAQTALQAEDIEIKPLPIVVKQTPKLTTGLT